MKLDSIDIEEAVTKIKRLLKEEQGLSPALAASIEIILLVVKLLVNRLNLNSKNSSKPPSTDPNRKKDKKPAGKRKPGGQKGHDGKTLEKTESPDRIKKLKDGWTILTADGKASAHFEHNVALIDGAPELLSSFQYIYQALGIQSDEEEAFRKEPLVL